MLNTLLLYIFNKRYAGKNLWFCNRIYEDIYFLPDTVRKCCHSTKMPYNPPLISKAPLKNFSLTDWIMELDVLMRQNQTGNAPCRGCKFFEKQAVPEYNPKESLKFITINHFTKCNSNCVYCGIGRKTEDIKFYLLPVLKQIIKYKMVNKDVLFNWGRACSVQRI